MATRLTGREIADRSGVSLATVSLVLNGKSGVSEETRQRVLTTAEQLGYRRHAQRPVIGVLIERLPIPAYGEPTVSVMIQGIETEATKLGYHMLLASVEPGTMQLPAMVTERQVGGVIVMGGGDLTDTYIRLLAATGIPLVLTDNVVDELALPCVLADNTVGGYLVTRHLLELGHRRIALLEGPRKYKTLIERREGFLRALDHAGMTPSPELMIKPVHGVSRKGYHQTREILSLPREQWPTAIVAISDKTALAALDALKDARLRVPEDMALVGFDDIDESAHVVPALTTVRLPMREIGQVAARQLIGSINGTETIPGKTVLYTELIVRQSSGAQQYAAETA